LTRQVFPEFNISLEMNSVLILEDEEEDALLLKRALTNARVENPVHRVANGPHAIAFLRGVFPFYDRKAFPLPAIMFVDLKLPGMDGFTFLEWVKSHGEYKDILIVVVTGYDDLATIRRACSLGASAFINKSCLRVDLESLLLAFPHAWMRAGRLVGGVPNSANQAL
jgi:CheY-like chemotaxis protein